MSNLLAITTILAFGLRWPMKKLLIILCCLAFVSFMSESAFAGDDDTNPQAQLISDTTLQKLGCVAAYGKTLQHQGCTIAGALDLTVPFHTTTRLALVVTQGPSDAQGDEPGELSFCFLENDKADCQYGPLNAGLSPTMNRLGDAPSIIYPTTDSRYPVIIAHAYWCCGIGVGPNSTMIWAYDPTTSKFNQIWSRGNDGLEDMKFETNGPLAGDTVVTVDNPTRRFPWPWGIEVYKFVQPDRYVRILSFTGKAVQAGKTPAPDAVIGIDMPEILRRLHLPN